MIYRLLSLFIIMLTFLNANRLEAADALNVETVQLKERLLQRKKSFDEHLRRQERRQAQRESRADEQRRLRESYAQGKEKARRQFRRPVEVFPVADYRRFIGKRDERRVSLEKARQSFVRRQQALRNIESDRRYVIDGNKEYQL